ncbi:DUF397 domain-containing protein [Streptomyces sp. NPDC001948]
MANPSTGCSPVLNWLKSGYSTNDGPACVEVAPHLRDCPRPQLEARAGAQLTFGPRQWSAFVSYATDH